MGAVGVGLWGPLSGEMRGVLSVNTIGYHPQHVYLKLDVHSRAPLAARLADGHPDRTRGPGLGVPARPTATRSCLASPWLRHHEEDLDA